MSRERVAHHATSQVEIAALKRSVDELYRMLAAYEQQTRIAADRLTVLIGKFAELEKRGEDVSNLQRRGR